MLIDFKALEILKTCSNKPTLSDRGIVTSHCDAKITSCIREETRKAVAGIEKSKMKEHQDKLTKLLVINYSSIYHFYIVIMILNEKFYFNRNV